MKKSMWLIHSMVLLAAVLLFGRPIPALAAEGRDVPMDRLERLERRVNEMAERQEQFMRRLGSQMERQATAGPPAQNPRPQVVAAPAPMAAAPPPRAAQLAKGIQDMLGLLFLIGVICNFLLAIWIFTDIRKRGEGSGIFIALALVAGIPAAIIYCLTRIGDRKV